MTIAPINGRRGSASRSGTRRPAAPRQLKSPLAAPGSSAAFGSASAGGPSEDCAAVVGPGSAPPSTSRASAHVCGTVTAGRSLTDISLGTASYVDMGGGINTDFRVPMLFVEATGDHDGRPAWISVAWRDRVPGHDPRRMLIEAGHRESRKLQGDWRDFRAYCAALDHDTNLTSHGTQDGNAIGYSSGNNAAVLTDDGGIRPGLDSLTAATEAADDGVAVRLTLPVTPPAA